MLRLIVHPQLSGCNENQNDPFLTKINSNRRVNCELGIIANVKLPATSEYSTLSTKYYIYELLRNSLFELNDEWPFSRWPFVRVAFCPDPT